MTQVRSLAARLADPEQAVAARAELRALLERLSAGTNVAQGAGAQGQDPSLTPGDAWAFVTGTCLLLRPAVDGAAGAAGDLPEAMLERARHVAERYGEQSGDKALGAWLAYEGAAYHFRRGGFERSIELARAAATPVGAAPGRTEFAARHLASEALRRVARWDEALAELRGLEERLDQAEVREGLGAEAWNASRAALHGARGDVLRRMGLVDLAAPEFESEESAARAANDPRAIASSVLHQADLWLLREQFGRAAMNVREVLSDPKRAQLGPEVLAQLRLTLGIALSESARESAGVSRQSKLQAEAREALESVAQGSGALEQHQLTADVTLIDLSLRSGDLKGAQTSLERAMVRARRIDPEEDLHETLLLRTQEARLSLARGEGELEASAVSMRRVFARLLEQWSSTPARPGGIGFLNLGNRREVLSTLMRIELASGPGGVERALEHWFRAEAQGSLARDRGWTPTSLAEVRERLLAPERGALVYLPAKDRSHLFVLDREVALHCELPSKDELRRPVDALLSALSLSRAAATDSGARARELQELSRVLGSLMVPEVARERLERWSGVSVVGLGLLGNPPLECLTPSEGQPLGLRIAVDRLPSLALGVHLARRAVRGKESPAAAPEFDLALVATLEPSRAARQLLGEAELFSAGSGDFERLQAGFEEPRVLSLTGSAATPRALFEAAPKTSILHVLAHGVYDPERERGAALALAPQDEQHAGLVGCEELERELERASALVILSACGAARSPLRYGDDGGAGLASAFLAAGAQCVVQSPRAVEYDATLRLMTALHAELRAGLPPAEGLRAARARIAAESDPLQNFYFAQFEVVGLGHADFGLR